MDTQVDRKHNSPPSVTAGCPATTAESFEESSDLHFSMPSPTSPESALSPEAVAIGGEHDRGEAIQNELLAMIEPFDQLVMSDIKSSNHFATAAEEKQQQQENISDRDRDLINALAAKLVNLETGSTKFDTTAQRPSYHMFGNNYRNDLPPVTTYNNHNNNLLVLPCLSPPTDNLLLSTHCSDDSSLNNVASYSPVTFADRNGCNGYVRPPPLPHHQPFDLRQPWSQQQQHFLARPDSAGSSAEQQFSFANVHHQQQQPQQAVEGADFTRNRSFSNYTGGNNNFTSRRPHPGTPLTPTYSYSVHGAGRQINGDFNGRYHYPSGPSPGFGLGGSPVMQFGGDTTREMYIIKKFGAEGTYASEFKSPYGFCLSVNNEIVVADTRNHRIQVFDNEGRWRHAFGTAGRDEGRLWNPRKVVYMRRSNRLAVFDEGVDGSRMQLFTVNGDFVKKISLTYLETVAGVTTTRQNDIVIVDSIKPTCFVYTEMGELRKWFDCSKHMTEPSDVAVWNNCFYICDFKEHCICVFDQFGKFMRKIGGRRITDFPNGIDITSEGDILVADSHGNRMHVCKLDQNGKRLADYECSQRELPKVSRCCGLKLTNTGEFISLVRNSHLVLIMTPDPQSRALMQAAAAAAINPVMLPPMTSSMQGNNNYHNNHHHHHRYGMPINNNNNNHNENFVQNGGNTLTPYAAEVYGMPQPQQQLNSQIASAGGVQYPQPQPMLANAFFPPTFNNNTYAAAATAASDVEATTSLLRN